MRRLLPLLALALCAASSAFAEPNDLIVVLTDTGRTCQSGLPVLTSHPQSARYLPALTTGVSGRLLRAYRLQQRWLAAREGRAVEPAYLLLSSNQGGFPRTGFCLDEIAKPEAGFVDLQASQRISGAFGAIDQIFPHEQLHIILRQLAGEPPVGGANQVHAIGVRTDPQVAFNEGFAEHIQVLAIDDAEALPETAALRNDIERRARADRQLEAYRQTLAARWAPAARYRLGFVLWFGSAEQVLRYHGVKDNRFAWEPAIPERLLVPRDPYGAYLVENVVPGDAGQPRKSQGRLRATEGVVAAFFLRLVIAPTTQHRYEDAAFYHAFGTDAGAVPPIENAYLKVFTVLAEAKAFDIAAFARAYRARFPVEADTVQRVADDVGLDLEHDAPALWVLNNAFTTGTTLFDQYRGVPRAHTFDLNAASLVDLLGVPGMTTIRRERHSRRGPLPGALRSRAGNRRVAGAGLGVQPDVISHGRDDERCGQGRGDALADGDLHADALARRRLAGRLRRPQRGRLPERPSSKPVASCRSGPRGGTDGPAGGLGARDGLVDAGRYPPRPVRAPGWHLAAGS